MCACSVRPDATTPTSQKLSANAQMAFGSAPVSACNLFVLSLCLLVGRILAILKSMLRVATTENIAALVLVPLLRFAVVKPFKINPVGSVPLLPWSHATRKASKRLVVLVIVPKTATPVLVTMDVVMLAVAQMRTRASATLLVSMKAVERRASFLWVDGICRPSLLWTQVNFPTISK